MSLPALICLPSSDAELRDFAEYYLSLLARVTPGELEGALARHYPHARVRRRELAGELVETWYVYRDRSFPARDDEVNPG